MKVVCKLTIVTAGMATSSTLESLSPEIEGVDTVLPANQSITSRLTIHVQQETD